MIIYNDFINKVHIQAIKTRGVHGAIAFTLQANMELPEGDPEYISEEDGALFVAEFMEKEGIDLVDAFF